MSPLVWIVGAIWVGVIIGMALPRRRPPTYAPKPPKDEMNLEPPEVDGM